MRLNARIPRDPVPRMGRTREGDSPKYILLIKQLPCAVYSFYPPSDPHHLMRVTATSRGASMRNEDRWAIPLSRKAHDELHAYKLGTEEDYLASKGVLGRELAAALWACRDEGLDAMQRVMFRHSQDRSRRLTPTHTDNPSGD